MADIGEAWYGRSKYGESRIVVYELSSVSEIVYNFMKKDSNKNIEYWLLSLFFFSLFSGCATMD